MKHPLRLPKFLLITILLMVFLTSSQQKAFSQPNQGQATKTATLSKFKQTLESFIEKKAKEQLHLKTDDYLSRRLDKSSYLLDIEVMPDKQKINNLIAGWGTGEPNLLLATLEGRDYAGLRPYLSEATITVGFSNRLSQAEWQPLGQNLTSYLAGSDDAIEQVNTRVVAMPPPPAERAILRQAEEHRKALEIEASKRLGLEKERARNEKDLKNQESKLRREELELKFKLEEKKQKKGEEELKSELEAERKKRRDLGDQILNDENIKDRLIKEMPILTRIAAAGASIGTFLLVALLLFGVLVILAFKALGKSVKEGSEGLAEAIKEGGQPKLGPRMEEEPEEEEKKDEEDLDDDPAVAFEHKPQLKEAAEQLKIQVGRDIETAAAMLSKLVEQEKFGETVAIFDILGTELAQSVFKRFTSSARKLLQRSFYTGAIKRPHPSKLFNRINELRSMLATTDVLMRDQSEKALAQVILSYSDEDIAKAAGEIDDEQGAAMLTTLPAERMLNIMRNLPAAKAGSLRKSLGRVVRIGVALESETVNRFTRSLLDEGKLRFEENKKFLQSIIAVAEEQEVDDILLGLEEDAHLLLEVIGIRATIDDLWAQAPTLIESLLSIVELDISTALLYDAPAPVRAAILAAFPERKRILTQDALENLEKDDAHRTKMLKDAVPGRKAVLAKLTEMATSNSVTLPSREKLLQMADKQRVASEDAVASSASAATAEAASKTPGAA